MLMLIVKFRHWTQFRKFYKYTVRRGVITGIWHRVNEQIPLYIILAKLQL